MWNFGRAQDLYTEVFCMTGDSSPMVSFCKMCDDVLIDPTIRDGYKLQILENYDIKARFNVNDELAPGEYRYFAEFDQEGYKLLIEGGEFDDYFRTYGYKE